MSASRYLKSIGGNASVSAASLASAAAVFSVYSAAEFGFYSLVLIFSTLMYSVINSLFVASMQDYVTTRELPETDLAAFVVSNSAAVLVLAIAFGCFTQLTYDSLQLTASVVVFLLVAGLRWLVKSYRQMLSDVNGYVLSDAILAAGLFVLAVAVFLMNFKLFVFFWLMSLTQLASLWPLNIKSLTAVLSSFSFSSVSKIKDGYQQRGRDALLGTFNIELSQNSHSYLISIFAGPHAFAPIALANLMFRPFAVVMTGLVQAERPLISKMMFEKQYVQANGVCQKLTALVLTALAVNTVAVIGVVYLFEDYLMEKIGHLADFVVVLIMILAVCIARAFRFSFTLFFQSAGLFAVLKDSCLYGGLMTIVMVSALLSLGFIQTSVFGVVCGEVLMLVYLSQKHTPHRHFS